VPSSSSQPAPASAIGQAKHHLDLRGLCRTESPRVLNYAPETGALQSGTVLTKQEADPVLGRTCPVPDRYRVQDKCRHACPEPFVPGHLSWIDKYRAKGPGAKPKGRCQESRRQIDVLVLAAQ